MDQYMVKSEHNAGQFGTQLTYLGQQPGMRSELLYRCFNLNIDGRVPTFAVLPGEDIKTKMREVQIRFARKDAA